MKAEYQIKVNDQEIGSADLCTHPANENVWLISRISVHKEAQRNGYGTRLLGRICRDADKENAALEVHVAPCNKHLFPWYIRHDFMPFASGMFRRLANGKREREAEQAGADRKDASSET